MPSRSATASIAFCGNQPPHCACARHRTGITADCWRPAGYLSICALAHARLSGVNAKLGGCFSARRRTDTARDSLFHRFAILGVDRSRIRRLRDVAEHQRVAFLQVHEPAALLRRGDARDRIAVVQQRLNARLLILSRGCDKAREQDAGGKCDTADHRSTSPNTMSMEPRTAETSASMWPRQRKSIAARWAKPGARILHLYGLLLPSATR